MTNTEDVDDLVRELAEVREQVAQLTMARRKGAEEQKALEEELSQLNCRVRNAIHRGERLPPLEYTRVCNRQNAVKKKLSRVQREAAKRSGQMEALRQQENALINRVGPEKLVVVPSTVQTELDALYTVCAGAETACEALRTKYAAFAGDMTRVSSMRVMAAQFSEELMRVLKILQSLGEGD